MLITFKVNGETVQLDVKPNETLLDVLREKLYLTGAKEGCGNGECGACTVLFNGKPVNSCLVLAPEADGAEITTVEAFSADGKLDPVQEAFIEEGALQCGFCTPGFIVSVKALLKRNPKPSREDIIEALSGNLCRCTGYSSIIKAVERAAERGAE
ncbi:MAG: (2Fe-2S)-binding protein [Thermotogae bacterium]|nr:(2Fe-2S)-binding protein [Thermotogota bacterium]RKX45942.1 MAG: (2Fe-2S)-binding protein [Thermotogota bacterium]